MKLTGIAAAILGISAVSISGPGYAQNADLGKYEYDNSCAVCHGAKGEGDGPYAILVVPAPSNLTTLAKRNNGVFPFQRVYEFIDGRQLVQAHGPSNMPIWGDRYTESLSQRQFTPGDPQAWVHTRILALTEYVNRLQAK